MSDVVFIALTIVVFAVMAVVVRGVERLVGQLPSSKQHTTKPAAVGAPADGQVVR